jgi:O-antigen ligase
MKVIKFMLKFCHSIRQQYLDYQEKYPHMAVILSAIFLIIPFFPVFETQEAGVYSQSDVWVSSWSKWLALSIIMPIIILLIGKWQEVVALTRLEQLFILLVGYLALSSLWNPDTHNMYVTLVFIGVLLCFYWRLRVLSLETLLLKLEIFAIASVVVLHIYMIAHISNIIPIQVQYSFGNRNFPIEFLAMLMPIFIYHIYRRQSLFRMMIHSSLLFLLIVFLATKSESRAWLIGFGILPFIWMWRHPNRYVPLIGLLIGVLITIAVLAYFPYGIEDDDMVGNIYRSIHHRFQIWLASLSTIPDYPIFGIGMGGYTYHYPLNSLDYYKIAPILGHPLDDRFFNPGQVHNEYLQILIEGGLVGFLLFLALFWHLLQAFKKLSLEHAILISGLFVLMGIGLISFPLQRVEGLVMLVMYFAVFNHIISETESTEASTEKSSKAKCPKAKCPIRHLVFMRHLVFKPFYGLIMGALMMGMFTIAQQATAAWTYYTYVLSVAQQNIKSQGISITNLQAILHWPLLGPRFDLFHIFINSFPGQTLPKLTRSEVDYYYSLSLSATPNVPHNLIARLTYLFALGVQKQDIPEIVETLDRLEAIGAPLYSWAYSLRAQYAIIRGDRAGVKHYYEKAIAQPIIDPILDKPRIKYIKKWLGS